MKQIKLKNSNLYFIIDEEDYNLVSRYTWYLAKRHKNYYVITGSGNNKILLHRLILNVIERNIHVDHINHDGLDNRKLNLRICSNTENRRNQRKRKNTSSKYKGVYWDKSKKKWAVIVTFEKKKYFLGRFNDEIDAAKCYNEFAKKYHKEFALLNEVI